MASAGDNELQTAGDPARPAANPSDSMSRFGPAAHISASNALPTAPVETRALRGYLPWFLILFAGSGCAALVYEIVWFQMLQLVIGSTAVSLGVLLVAFMGGLCLGSVLLPRRLSGRFHPIRVWACLELGIGLLGIGVLFLLPAVARAYASIVPAGVAGLCVRATLCLAFLVPPTLLMGATLPVISQLSGSSSEGASHLGLVYAANTIGAVVGALLAGFYLLRITDVYITGFVAVAINALLGLTGFSLPEPAQSEAKTESDCLPDSRGGLATNAAVHLSIALSGFCALGAEVVWTRQLALMLGATTYTFSIILAVFLAGLGIGSGLGALVIRQGVSFRVALGWSQLLVAAAIAWAALMMAKSLPYWPISPTLSKSIWFNFQLDLVRCLWAMLPAACLWGASFPLALAAIGKAGDNAGGAVGRLYAANTIGALLGAVACSVVLIGWIGTQQTHRVLIALSAVSGLLMFSRRSNGKEGDSTTEPGIQPQRRTLPAEAGVPEEGGTPPSGGRKPAFKLGSWLPSERKSAATLLVVCSLTGLLVWSVPRVPWPLVAYGRYLPGKSDLGTLLYMGEGVNASVAVTELDTGVRNFHVSGKIEASSDQRDMRLQRMLGHIPALFHPDPRAVLVVGCGAGVTAGSFLSHPRMERVTICEIEPLIPRVVANYFAEENYDLVQDPRVRFVYDDARHYVLTSHEKFDIVTSDPIHPWVKGAATLYTKEYFELCKQRLKPGGMVTQWVPLYESNLSTVRSEIATFFEVFPEGTLWSNDDMGEGYDLVLLGQVGPLEIDVDALQQRLSRADHHEVTESLREVGIRSAFGLVATYAGRARDLKRWLKPGVINRDRDLRLQYLAGMGLNFNESDLIFSDLSSYRRFPEEIFTGSNFWNDALRRALEQPKASQRKESKAASGPSGPRDSMEAGTNLPGPVRTN